MIRDPHSTVLHQDSAYQAVFEASSDGLVINDADSGIVLEANPAFCQMHGYQDMTGLHPTTFIHPTSHHLFREYLRTVRESGEFRARAQDVRSDGSVIFCCLKTGHERRMVYGYVAPQLEALSRSGVSRINTL